MARPTANLRLFVAIYPPATMSAALTQLLQLHPLEAHRVTADDQIHMTVQFVGDTPATALDATIESVQRAASGLHPFSLTPTRLISLPERGPARLVAAETDSHPTLLEVHRRLALRLAKNVRSRSDERFRPHMTLCRFRTPVHRLALDVPIALPPVMVERIRLMRSTLTHDGAMHHEIASVALE